MIIYLVGMPGSGKTTLGKGLSEIINLPLIDMDKVIEEHEGKTIPEIFSKEGETYFREIERVVLHEVSQVNDAIISTGGGAPCFFDNMEYMNKHGQTIFIDVSPEELYRRMQLSESENQRPLLNGKSDEALLKELQKKYKKRCAFYEKATYALKGDNLQVEDLKKLIA